MRRWQLARPGGAEELRPDAVAVREIAALLASGGIVLLPTDTIYGLHAVATDELAVARIAAMKGRDGDKPFVVIGASVAALEAIGVLIPSEWRTPLEALWPAPLTAVLPLRAPVAASRGTRSLAVRVPALGWLREVAALAGPLASTSANRSGNPPAREPREVPAEVLNALDGVVDGGPIEGEPSTIVDFTAGEPRLIRQGSPTFTQRVRKSLRISL